MRCAVCGSAEAREIGVDNGFHVVKCAEPSCGFVYVNPRPTPEELRTLYRTYYPEDPETAEAWGREMEGVFRECRARLLSHRPCGCVLDVGCSFGHFLEQMFAAGWTGVGIEPSPAAARHARERSGAPIVEGEFETVELPQAPFDAVVALYVLEHVADPRLFLRRMFAVLAEGGIALLRLPHTEPLMPLNRLLGRPLMQAPMHLNDFSPRCLRRLAQDVGFRRVEVRGGSLRRSSDLLERAGALLLGGTGRLFEQLTGGRVLFPWSGARTYTLFR